MTAKIIIVALVLSTTGCVTAPVGSRAGGGFGAIAGDLLGAHLRADRAAAKAVTALIGRPSGYFRARNFDERIEEEPVATLPSETRPNPALATHRVPDGREVAPSLKGPVMQSMKMEVGRTEMLTPEGALHPRAARALAEMESMAKEHDGHFSVFVPRSQMQTANAIRAVAPSASIFAADDDEHYRLIVVAATR